MEKFFYRVGEGETLCSIAQKFCIPPTKIIADNNLKREILEGDILYIERVTDRLYVVTPSDTLSSISQRFNVPAEKILLDNNIPYIFYGLTIAIKNN
jgi:spore germination protein YaaH